MAALWNDGYSAAEISRRLKTRSRNSVIGVITRMKERGDPRIVRCGAPQAPFTDAESLTLLAMREHDHRTFNEIGKELKRTAGACSAHYAEILRELRASEAVR